MQPTEQLNTALAGRYAIDRLIGEGGMATVYLARDVRHNRKVALKVLRPDLGAIVGVERFLSEIQVTANLQHPNLLPLFDSGQAGELLFYVMPYIEGESLRARIDREKQLPVDEAVRISLAIAGALDYAHRHGVIHRDLKPENILLHDGQPLVADFGIALAVSNAGGNRITQTGLSLGTPQYMSPEQATGDRTIDARTDVYSLGAVTYEMLAGEAPHTGTTSQAIIARVLTEKPRSIRASRPSVPPHVEAAVEHALEKLPADRISSAKEFGEALSGARPMTASSTSGSITWPAAATSARRRVFEASLALVAILGIVSSVFFATRRATQPAAGQFAIELPDSVNTTTSSTQTVALSPDGSEIAILGEKRGVRQIYLRRIDDPVAQAVRGTDGALYHSFSADGRALAFIVGGVLTVVPVTGGAPQKIADSTGAEPASWGSLNEVLYSDSRRIWAVSSDGGHRRVLSAPDTAHGVVALNFPNFLPDGLHALVTIRPANSSGDLRLGVVSLKDGSIVDLGILGRDAHYVQSGHIVFLRDGGLVFAAPFSLRRRKVTGPPVLFIEQVRQTIGASSALGVSQNGTIVYESGTANASLRMYVVDRKGTERELKGLPQAFWSPRVSPDAKHIVVQIGGTVNAGGLWIYEMASGSLTRLTPDSNSVRGEWTRDATGSNVVYIDRSGQDSERVVSRPWDGSGAAVTVAHSPRAYAYWDFSLGPPHGLSAVRHGLSAIGGDIYLAPTDSLGAAKPFIVGPANEISPRVSPTGRLLAYQSNASGQPEVYVTPIPGPGARVPVSVDGGTEPAWSPDGTTIFFRGAVHMIAATIAEKPLSVTRRDTLFRDVYLRTGPHTTYDVMPGGREFLMLRGPRMASSIFVIVNWQQLSRAKGASAPP